MERKEGERERDQKAQRKCVSEKRGRERCNDKRTRGDVVAGIPLS